MLCYDIIFWEQPKRGWKFGVFDPVFGFSSDAPEWTILPSPTISPFLVFENAHVQSKKAYCMSKSSEASIF